MTPGTPVEGSHRPQASSVRAAGTGANTAGNTRSGHPVGRVPGRRTRLPGRHDRCHEHRSARAAPPVPVQPAAAASPRRIGGIAESATLAVDAKAKALQGRRPPGDRVRRRRAGLPDPGLHRRGRAVAACRDPANHRYTPAGGLPALKEAIAAKTLRDSGYESTPAQVLVTNGGKQAVYQAFATLLDPGDEVLLPAPYWTTYPEAIRLAGGVPVEVVADETRATWSTVEPARGRPHRRAPRCCCSARRRTRPARSTRPSRSRRSAAGPSRTGLWVLTDEIYEHLVYDGARARLDAGRRARAAPTAASSSTGWPRRTR